MSHRRRPENGMEPIALYAHVPALLGGILKLEQATAKVNRVENRLKILARLKTSTIIECEFCMDLGSQIARRSGLTDEELLALPATGRLACLLSAQCTCSV